jgi:hypothetical protein
MALKNLNFDSAIRGILETRTDALGGIHAAATAKLEELGVTPTPAAAVRATPVHRRGPEKGAVKGSSNFNGMSIVGWIESIAKPADDASEADKAAYDDAVKKLLILHATVVSELA